MGPAMSTAKKRVAILISGRGSNMQTLVGAAKAADYPAEIALVVSNRPEAAGLAWAKTQGIPSLALDHTHFESREHFEGQLQGLLTTSRVDLVALAGFMRLMTQGFVERWRDRMLNIHPSLLPAFPGLYTHERVLEAGVTITGCTVHLVRAEMDSGPILAQAAVAVRANDTAETLGARVLEAEHQLYPSVLGLYAAGQFAIEGERARYLGETSQKSAIFSPPLASADSK